MAARKHHRTLEVRADVLKVHPEAQRQLSPLQIKKRMLDFDLDSIGTIHVVEMIATDLRVLAIDVPADQLWIIDGQHRWTALMQHGMGEWKVSCHHHGVVSNARACDLFLKLNDRAVVSAYDKFLNEVQSGNQVAIGAKRAAEELGLRVARQTGVGHIVCVTAMKGVYAADDGRTLEATLETVLAAWGKTEDAVNGKLIEGLAILLGAQNGAIDRAALAKKLAKYPGGPAGVIGDAKGLLRIRHTSVPRCVAETIMEAYNSGRRAENKVTLG
jgi:hypothetical protein